MSIRKVSDLPQLDSKSDGYTLEKFKKTLLEVSYPEYKETTIPRYTSRYMTMNSFVDSVYPILCSLYKETEERIMVYVNDLSAELLSLKDEVDSLKKHEFVVTESSNT